MFNDVELRIRKHNKILFTRNSECLQNLIRLIGGQKHITLVLWAFECIQIPMNELRAKYPHETAIQRAYDLSNEWAHGRVKMPIAKKEILKCHALAKKMEQDYDIALCHAIAQGCSTVHVETHALGLVFYELTAIVIKHNYAEYQVEVLDKIKFYADKLKWFEENSEGIENNQEWAEFLVRPKI